jgi:hypothetical protein
MKKILLLLIITIPFLSFAQQPKMNLKLIGGINTNSFIYQVEGQKADIFTGWQMGAGVRVMKRKAFLEFDGMYQNYGTSVVLFEDSALNINESLDVRMRALEFPITVGYIPVKTPFFKWFVYGGFVNKFSLNGRLKFMGEEVTFKPKELDLHFYNLHARFGTQFDVAMFNFDINYNVGVTNAIKNKARTNTNGLQFSVALLF